MFYCCFPAYQPGGYLGCYDDIEGESLVDPVLLYDRLSVGNTGNICKLLCKSRAKRYAGTKERRCYCGSGVLQHRKLSSTECNQPCPGNFSERCGGFNRFNSFDRISLYDTWLCMTGPCHNGATCTYIDADNYNCSCRVGWTGRVCNETVIITTYTEHTQSTSTTESIGSSTVTKTDVTIIYTIFLSYSTQSIVAAQPSENKFAIYIAVPVSIFVLIVFVLIITVLILRKRPNQNDDGLHATYQTSANAAAGDNDHNYDAVERTGYNDHNYDAVDRTGDNDHNYYSINQTGGGDRN